MYMAARAPGNLSAQKAWLAMSDAADAAERGTVAQDAAEPALRVVGGA